MVPVSPPHPCFPSPPCCTVFLQEIGLFSNVCADSCVKRNDPFDTVITWVDTIVPSIRVHQMQGVLEKCVCETRYVPFNWGHLYLNVFVCFLLFFRDYVRSELESGYEGPMYLEPLSMNRFMTALIGKCR